MKILKKLLLFIGTIAMSLGASSCSSFLRSGKNPVEEEMRALYVDAIDNGYYRNYETFVRDYFSNPQTASKAKEINLEKTFGTYKTYSFLTEDGYQGSSNIRTSSFSILKGYELYCAINPSYFKNKYEWNNDLLNNTLPEPSKSILDIDYEMGLYKSETLIVNNNTSFNLKYIDDDYYRDIYFKGYIDIYGNTYRNNYNVRGNSALLAQVTKGIKSAKILNKDALKDEWRVGDRIRYLNITIESEIYNNIDEAFANNGLRTISSNPDVIECTNEQINPIAVGKSTISLVNKTNEVLDSIEIEVLKEEIAIVPVRDIYGSPDPDIINTTAYSNKKYLVDGIVVSSDQKRYMSLYDGTGIVLCYFSGQATNTYYVGDKIKVKGKLNNYSGLIELVPDVIEPSQNILSLPNKEILSDQDYISSRQEFIANESKLVGPAPKVHYVELTGTYIGLNGSRIYLSTKDSNLSFDLSNSSFDVKNKLQTFNKGSTIKVIGTYYTYKSKYDNFSIIVDDAVFISEGITQITGLTITADKLQSFVNEPIYMAHTTEPSGAIGDVTYRKVSGDANISVKGSRIYGVTPGQVIIEGELLGVVSNQITLTIIQQDTALNTIEELYKSVPLETNVRSSGIITHIVNKTEFFVQDGYYAISVYNPNVVGEGLVIGSQVEISGTLTIYKGRLEIKNGSVLAKANNAQTPVETRKASLSGIDGYWCNRIVNFVGFITGLPGTGIYNLDLKLSDTNVIKINFKYTDANEVSKLDLMHINDKVEVRTYITILDASSTNQISHDKNALRFTALAINPYRGGDDTLTATVSKNNLDIGESLQVSLGGSYNLDFTNYKFNILEGPGSVEHYMVNGSHYLKGVTEGSCTIEVVVDFSKTTLSLVVSNANVDPYNNITDISFSDYKNLTENTTTTLYRIKGVVNKVVDAKRGSLELVEKETNNRLVLNSINDKRAFRLENGTFCFTKSSNLGEMLNNSFSLGDEISVLLTRHSPYFTLEGVFETRIVIGNEVLYHFKNLPEYLVPDKVEGYHFGEKFTLSVDSSKLPAGQEIAFVKINNIELSKTPEGTYCGIMNLDLDVNVILKNDGEVQIKSTISPTTLNPLSVYPTVEQSAIVEGLSLNYIYIAQFNSGILQCRRDTSYIYLTKEAPQEIDSITINLSKACPKSAPQALFSLTQVNSAPSGANSSATLTQTELSFTFKNNVAGAKFFALNFYGAVTYVSSIEVNYKI